MATLNYILLFIISILEKRALRTNMLSPVPSLLTTVIYLLKISAFFFLKKKHVLVTGINYGLSKLNALERLKSENRPFNFHSTTSSIKLN